MADVHATSDPEPGPNQLEADLATVDAITQALRWLVPDIEEEVLANDDWPVFDLSGFADPPVVNSF